MLDLGGPANLRTVSLEFGIDAKREELSILTVLVNPIASASVYCTAQRSTRRIISGRAFPIQRVPRPGCVTAAADWEPSGRTVYFSR